MADRAQRPPAPYVEGEDYVWHDEFQAYVSYDENGVLGYWDAGADDWVNYPATGTLEDEPEAMRQAAEVLPFDDVDDAKNFLESSGYKVGNQAIFSDRRTVSLPDGSTESLSDEGVIALANEVSNRRDEERARMVPDAWDTERYGEFPIIDYTDGTFEADWETARKRIADIDAVNPLPAETPQNTPLPEGKKRVISEGGWDFAYDPATRDYTDVVGRTPEKPKRSADQMILDYYEAGEFDKAFALDAFLDEIERPKGLTPAQAVQEIMNLAVAPDEAREWIDALTDDWNAVRSTEERVTSPGKSLFPTDEERAQQAQAQAQTPAALGTGLPAGLGQGAGGLQFPAWLTQPGGMPPGAPTGALQTSAFLEQDARNREAQAQSASAIVGAADRGQIVFNPATNQWEAASPFGLNLQQQASLGPEQLAEAQRMQGQGLEEFIRQQNAKQQPAFTSPGYAPGLLPGQTTPSGTLTPEQVAAIKATPQFSMPFTTSISAEQLADMPEAANAVEAAKKAAGLPYNVKDRYTGGIGYVFQPTTSFKTRAQEFPETTPLPFASIPGATTKPLFEARTAVPSTTTGTTGMGSNPLFRQQQVAAFKRGDIAQFEKGLFGLSKPLSAQDVLEQAFYRQWGKRRQAQFAARPVQRTSFR